MDELSGWWENYRKATLSSNNFTSSHGGPNDDQQRVNQLLTHEMFIEFMSHAEDSARSWKTELLLWRWEYRFLSWKDGACQSRRPTGLERMDSWTHLALWAKAVLVASDRNLIWITKRKCIVMKQSPGIVGGQPGFRSNWNQGLYSHQDKGAHCMDCFLCLESSSLPFTVSTIRYSSVLQSPL